MPLFRASPPQGRVIRPRPASAALLRGLKQAFSRSPRLSQPHWAVGGKGHLPGAAEHLNEAPSDLTAFPAPLLLRSCGDSNKPSPAHPASIQPHWTVGGKGHLPGAAEHLNEAPSDLTAFPAPLPAQSC